MKPQTLFLSLLAGSLALIACQSRPNATSTSPSAAVVSQDGGAVATVFATPSSSPIGPGPAPSPLGPGPAPSPVGPRPAPSPVGPNPGPRPGPPTPTPPPGTTPTPAPGGSPTPTPTPSTTVTLSGADAGRFTVFTVPADGDYARHTDETWRDGLLAGDVLIRTANSDRYLTSLDVVLNVTSNVDVNVLIYFTASPPWLDANGFPHLGSGTSYETPTISNPSSSDVFSIRKKTVGMSGTATLGPNGAYSYCDTSDPAIARDCSPMFWLVVRPVGQSVF